MAIIGVILLAAAVVAGTELAVSNRSAIEGELFNYTVANATPMAFLLAGALLALVAVFGLMLITGGIKRSRRRRVASKHRAHDATDDRDALVAENERLRTELTTYRRQEATMGGVAVPPGVGDVAYGDQVSDAVRSTTISDTGRYEPYPADPARSTVDVTDGATEDTRGHGRRTVDH